MTDGTPEVEKKDEAPTPELKKITLANGEVIELGPTEMVIALAFDQATGQTAIYEVQNCPLRAYAKMILTEAAEKYLMLSVASNTAKHLVDLQEKKKFKLFG